ncbi:hypothetical protein [Nocardioides sp.]|uniref:hypothetical protein n=1 Tax=Nocardioides sp. TaxID=35761 RepID=UPI003D108E70
MTIKTARIACGLGSLAAVALLFAGCSGASDPQDIGSTTVSSTPTKAASPALQRDSKVATAMDGACSSSYTHGWTSVDMVITNNTPFTLNFESDLSGPSTGHWHQRPAQTLEPGQCEVVNAYASADLEIFNLNVVYSTTWGDYFPFSGTANGTAPTFNPNVFDGEPQYHESGQYWSGSIDSRYTITSSGQAGQLHTHFNLTLS